MSMSIYNEYNEKYDEFITSELSRIGKHKISGNFFSHIMRNSISKILNKKYILSVVNSYIKGCSTEWDLLILKNTVSKEEQNINIYYPENVICALEFKTSGISYKTNPEICLEYMETYLEKLNMLKQNNPNVNIKYGYISLCENPKNLTALMSKYQENCFWIIEGWYSSAKKNGTNDIKGLEEFLLKLIDKK